MKSKKQQELRLAAIEVRQGKRSFYAFAVDGKQVPSFATVSRLKRRDDAGLSGYQRPEVLAHITEIRDYIESESPMIPNAVVIAFDKRVKFEAAIPFVEGPKYSRVGTLVIPIPKEEDAELPGFIVDGQQRLAAIRDANVESFPVAVTAFIASDTGQQIEQFILINSTKPLQKALIYELLPGTEGHLPTSLEKRRFPSFLLDRLNRDENSPFKGKIQTPTTPNGIIKDNSILRLLENSLAEGALYRFKTDGDEGDEDDVEAMVQTVTRFWRAVARVWPNAWNSKPRNSRLVHGVGIVSLGFIMDMIADRWRSKTVTSETAFYSDLLPLKDVCRWTDGYWDFGPGYQRKWNELQNTSKDIQMLANYLRVQYKDLVWTKPAA